MEHLQMLTLSNDPRLAKPKRPAFKAYNLLLHSVSIANIRAAFEEDAAKREIFENLDVYCYVRLSDGTDVGPTNFSNIRMVATGDGVVNFDTPFQVTVSPQNCVVEILLVDLASATAICTGSFPVTQAGTEEVALQVYAGVAKCGPSTCLVTIAPVNDPTRACRSAVVTVRKGEYLLPKETHPVRQWYVITHVGFHIENTTVQTDEHGPVWEESFAYENETGRLGVRLFDGKSLEAKWVVDFIVGTHSLEIPGGGTITIEISTNNDKVSEKRNLETTENLPAAGEMGETASPQDDTGRRPSIGLSLKFLDDEEGNQKCVCVVHDVDNTVQDSDIQPQDILEKWNDTIIHSRKVVHEKMANATIGEVVSFIVSRNGSQLKLPLTVGSKTTVEHVTYKAPSEPAVKNYKRPVRPALGLGLKFLDAPNGKPHCVCVVHDINNPLTEILPEDVLEKWEDEVIDSADVVRCQMKPVKIGDIVQFTVVRSGERLVVPLTICGAT